jgi:hypothetical protein
MTSNLQKILKVSFCGQKDSSRKTNLRPWPHSAQACFSTRFDSNWAKYQRALMKMTFLCFSQFLLLAAASQADSFPQAFPLDAGWQL